MRRTTARGLILASAVLAVGLVSRAEPAPDAAPGLKDDGAVLISPKPVGISTCASAACHGRSNAPSLTSAPAEGCWQSSLTHYLAVDPHRQAFDVLKNEKSARITAGLRKKSSVPIPDAWNDARCLACHTNPSLAPETVPESWKSLRGEGVSCEACHGDATNWKGPHTAWDQATRPRGMVATGFVDLNVPRVRAETCVGCHYGAPAKDGVPVRDMNHDMIAAGHPELKFDYETLLARLPKHWFERERHATALPPDGRSPASVYPRAVEQLKSDRQKRNTAGDPRTPYPELSDQWACVKCHRELGPK
jgi:hypothetical protein